MRAVRTILLVIGVLCTIVVFSFNVKSSNVNGVEESRVTIGVPSSPAFIKHTTPNSVMTRFNFVSQTSAFALAAILCFVAYRWLGRKATG
jgi:hypothetical protein